MPPPAEAALVGTTRERRFLPSLAARRAARVLPPPGEGGWKEGVGTVVEAEEVEGTGGGKGEVGLAKMPEEGMAGDAGWMVREGWLPALAPFCFISTIGIVLDVTAPRTSCGGLGRVVRGWVGGEGEKGRGAGERGRG